MKLTTFSQEKVLRYYYEYQNYKNTGNVLIPPCIGIDLSGYCNNNCYFCNSKMTHNKKNLTLEQVQMIYNQLNSNTIWIAGGGEPLLNPDYIKIDEYFNLKNVNKLLTTNGTLLNTVIESIYNYISIGISFDCISFKMFNATRGGNLDQWKSLIKGIERTNSIKQSHTIQETIAKVLITKYNYTKLPKLVNMCKNLGFDSVYIRPAGLTKIKDKDGKYIDLTNFYINDIEIIKENLEKSLEYQSDTFTVYYSTQLKDDYVTPKYDFTKCYACMLEVTFCTDGYAYICMEQRGNPKFRLCEHKDYKKVFNSDAHKALINSIDFIHNCPRCSKATMNSIIEKCLIQDKIRINIV